MTLNVNDALQTLMRHLVDEKYSFSDNSLESISFEQI